MSTAHIMAQQRRTEKEGQKRVRKQGGRLLWILKGFREYRLSRRLSSQVVRAAYDQHIEEFEDDSFSSHITFS